MLPQNLPCENPNRPPSKQQRAHEGTHTHARANKQTNTHGRKQAAEQTNQQTTNKRQHARSKFARNEMRNEDVRVFMQRSAKYSTKQTWLTNATVAIVIKFIPLTHPSRSKANAIAARPIRCNFAASQAARFTKFCKPRPNQKTQKTWFTGSLLRDSFRHGKTYVFLLRFFGTNEGTL